MGFQDRDYYREWWAKKEGHVEKSPLRMNLGRSESLPLVPMAIKNRSRSWHPVLIFLFTFFLCAGVFLLLKVLVWIQALFS